jgi:hypothetical protein
LTRAPHLTLIEIKLLMPIAQQKAAPDPVDLDQCLLLPPKQ